MIEIICLDWGTSPEKAIWRGRCSWETCVIYQRMSGWVEGGLAQSSRAAGFFEGGDLEIRELIPKFPGEILCRLSKLEAAVDGVFWDGVAAVFDATLDTGPGFGGMGDPEEVEDDAEVVLFGQLQVFSVCLATEG
jgi:hypothetical protein